MADPYLHVLLVASETGSYGFGGSVAAAGAVTTALAGPVIGRLADTLGQRRLTRQLYQTDRI